MSQETVVMDVREINPRTSVVDIKGDVTTASEQPLADAHARASRPTTQAVVLNSS